MVAPQLIGVLMFPAVVGGLLLGFPVAFTLAGVSIAFAALAWVTGAVDTALLGSISPRIFGIMTNQVFVAIPLFIFMGIILERSRIANDLLVALGSLFGTVRGGLGLSVVLVGTLLAASTGVIAASIITMGLLSLPAMLRTGYDPKLACGIVCASGSLGQIIPPSTVLILLGDILQGANTQAQMAKGNFAPEPVSVMDLFAGALIPGFVLVGLYCLWIIFCAVFHKDKCPAISPEQRTPPEVWNILNALVAPLILIVAVLGAILGGLATATEAGAIGAIGAVILSIIQRRFNLDVLFSSLHSTMIMSSMIFLIIIGASIFSLVFRMFGGDIIVESFLHGMPGGAMTAFIFVMIVIFFLGFVLDFIEIMFLVLPIVAPILLMSDDISPVWFGVLIALNVQTSFLTPPFGFALFYLRSVAPSNISTGVIVRGVVPFIVLQIIAIVIIFTFPSLATWLPNSLYR